MAFNIETFKHNGLVYGGVRPSLFDVTMTPSPELNSLFGGIDLEKLKFTCRASNLPASTIGTVEVPYFGRRIKLAGDRTYADWQITVMNDEDFLVRSIFEVWHNSLNKIINNVRDSTFVTETLYKAVFEISQYSKTGNSPQGGGAINATSVTPIRSYVMVGAYPTTLSDIAVDWEQQNQIETFTVGVAYDYWEPGVEGSLSVPYGQTV